MDEKQNEQTAEGKHPTIAELGGLGASDFAAQVQPIPGSDERAQCFRLEPKLTAYELRRLVDRAFDAAKSSSAGESCLWAKLGLLAGQLLEQYAATVESAGCCQPQQPAAE